MIRARVLQASHAGDLARALPWAGAEGIRALARGMPARALLLEGTADPAALERALSGAGAPYIRRGDTLAWVADPATIAAVHERLRAEAPEALDALHLALGAWASPLPDVPLPKGGSLRLSTGCLVMGIVNVTPDSFSDGGRFIDPAAAVEHGLRLAEQGADILDVGGESTRPGAEPVSAAEEARRALPVIEALAARAGVPVSVDTTKAEVARDALDAGAAILNDVSAGRADPAMLPLAAERGAPIVLMHMRGDPRTMQDDPRYDDLVGEVAAFLGDRAAAAREAGAAASGVLLDPGFGFGKTREHNLTLLRRLRELRCAGYPLVVGTSRKSFIGATLDLPPERRLEGTAATVALAVWNGAAVVRVHDVEAMRRVVGMVEAVMAAG